MISKRQKISASAAALVAGAGLALVLAGGSAGASAPHTPPVGGPNTVVVTRSAAPNASEKLDPKAPRPTLTITAAPAPGGPGSAPDTSVVTVGAEPGASIPVDPRHVPTTTVYATPSASPSK